MNTSALRVLSLEQRLHLVEELWDSIAAEQGMLDLTEAQKRELDQRLDAYELDQDPGRTLTDVISDIRKRV
jgi:putative addiction module component (TIGR02574 family)